MANTQRVYVYATGDVFVPYRVFPPVTILKKNETMEVVNTTDVDALWEVPPGLLDDGAINETVPGKGGRKSKDAKKDGLRVGAYQVSVGGRRAHAHSDPRIIIDL